jgi:PAS domain-containing protein
MLIEVDKHFNDEIEEISQVIRLTHKDGHEVKILRRGRVVRRDENGKPLRMVGTHHLIKDV